MAYKIMQKGEDGILREVVLRGETVRGSDFDPGLLELKQFDDDDRSFTAVGSTGNPDRVEDIVDHKGWILDNFEKNPVGMWAHNYSMLPIFRVSDVEIKPRAKKMLFRANFDDHEFAENVYQSYRKQFMKGFSVGFLPLEYELRDRDEMTDEEKQRAGFWGGYHFKKQELLEISAAPIPMHPEALADIKALGIPTDMETKCYFPLSKATMPDGRKWYPIEDPKDFTDVMAVPLEDNVKVVNGKPLESDDEGQIIARAIGYIFPSNFGEDRIAEWFSKSGLSEARVSSLTDTSTIDALELEVKEDGTFSYILPPLESVEDVEEPEIVTEDSTSEDNVEEIVDNTDEVLLKIREPESIVLEFGKLIINTEVGQIVFDAQTLRDFGIETRTEEIVNVADRDRFEKAIYTIATLLEKNFIQEPVPEEPIVPQPVEEETSLADVGVVLESIRDEARSATEIDLGDGVTISADSDEFSEIVSEVLTEQLGATVGATVRKRLREASGNLE